MCARACICMIDVVLRGHSPSYVSWHWLHTVQGFYRLGVAFQGLDEHEEAMVAYADGLISDSKQESMLHGLIEVMLKSPYRGKHVCPTKVITSVL